MLDFVRLKEFLRLVYYELIYMEKNYYELIYMEKKIIIINRGWI